LDWSRSNASFSKRFPGGSHSCGGAIYAIRRGEVPQAKVNDMKTVQISSIDSCFFGNVIYALGSVTIDAHQLGFDIFVENGTNYHSFNDRFLNDVSVSAKSDCSSQIFLYRTQFFFRDSAQLFLDNHPCRIPELQEAFDSFTPITYVSPLATAQPDPPVSVVSVFPTEDTRQATVRATAVSRSRSPTPFGRIPAMTIPPGETALSVPQFVVPVFATSLQQTPSPVPSESPLSITEGESLSLTLNSLSYSATLSFSETIVGGVATRIAVSVYIPIPFYTVVRVSSRGPIVNVPSEPEDRRGLDAGTIVGIVTGAAVALALIIGAAIYMIRMRRVLDGSEVKELPKNDAKTARTLEYSSESDNPATRGGTNSIFGDSLTVPSTVGGDSFTLTENPPDFDLWL
jgi:hypothetical protein